MLQDRPPSRIAAYLYQFDYLLFAFVLMTTAFGLVVLDGTTHNVPNLGHFSMLQLQWFFVSLAVFAVALAVPYRWLHALGWPLYLVSIALLLFLLIASRYDAGVLSAVTAKGAASWYRIQLGSFSIRFQPSEFAKIAVVIVLAQWLAWRRDRLDSVWECLVPVALAALPMAIIFKQPDFGTAAVFLPLPVILLFVAGLRWRVALSIAAAGLVFGVCATIYLATADEVPGLRPYQLSRIRVFLNPLTSPFEPPAIEDVLYGDRSGEDEGPQPNKKGSAEEWNIRQAEMALGSGRLWGKGWRQGSQSRLRFLPQPHTDFIFSSLGEQFGVLGCGALLALHLLLLWRVVRLAILTPDPFGRYLIVGLFSIVLTHVFLNIAMSIRLLPVTGLPLPFFSYGGSFLAANYLIFGLISNVGMRRPLPPDSRHD